MSENIVIALITAGGALCGGIIGAIINAYATLKAAGMQVQQTPSQAIQEAKKQSPHWMWGIIIGAVIGAGITLIMLAFLGIIPIGSTSSDLPVTDSVYDDFNNSSFNGAFDDDLWLPYFSELCDVAQHEGSMVFKNKPSQDEAADCRLIINRSRLVPFDNLGSFEAQIKISSDHTGGYVNQGVQFATNEISGDYWAAFCGLNATGGFPKAEFEIWSNKGGVETHREIDAVYDRWHTVRLELDPETMEVECFADDILVGSAIPKDAAELHTARFERYLNMFRDKGSLATSYTDDVKINP